MSCADTSQAAGMDANLVGQAACAPCADPGAGAVRVIAARRGGLGVDVGEWWRYRELLYFLVWRDLKARYKQTVLGAAWAILQPVLTIVVFTAVFGHMLGVPSDDVPYAIFVCAGVLPWTLFAGAVAAAGTSLVNQAHLFTKVYFPRIYIPASSSGVVVVDFLLALVVYAGLMLWYMWLPGLSVLLLPLLTLILLVMALGLGLGLAAVTVTYRDFRPIIPFMLQLWMYLSPVVYGASLVPQRYRWLLTLNPMTGVINGFRSCLLNRPVNWTELAVAGGAAVLMLAAGLWHFGRTERRFADIA